MKVTRALRNVKTEPDKVFFGPGMSSPIEEIVQSCDICIKHRNKQQKEPLMPHDIPDSPWKKLGTDLLAWNGNDYL